MAAGAVATGIRTAEDVVVTTDIAVARTGDPPGGLQNAAVPMNDRPRAGVVLPAGGPPVVVAARMARVLVENVSVVTALVLSALAVIVPVLVAEGLPAVLLAVVVPVVVVPLEAVPVVVVPVVAGLMVVASCPIAAMATAAPMRGVSVIVPTGSRIAIGGVTRSVIPTGVTPAMNDRRCVAVTSDLLDVRIASNALHQRRKRRLRLQRRPQMI